VVRLFVDNWFVRSQIMCVVLISLSVSFYVKLLLHSVERVLGENDRSTKGVER